MFRPLRAGTAPSDLSEIIFPVLVSTKLNGIRVLITEDGPKTRKLEEIPNVAVRKMLAKLPVGFDGEITCGDLTAKDVWNKTQSMLMSEDGGTDFIFHVFDDFSQPDQTFEVRQLILHKRFSRIPYTWCALVPNHKVYDAEMLEGYFRQRLAEGHEGIMIRSLDGPYKHGESTVKEGYLLKMKPRQDSEAKITGVYEQMANLNAMETNNIGLAKRSTKKEGKFGKGILGGFLADWKHPDGSIKKLRIGGGISKELREKFWKNPPIDDWVKFSFQELSSKGMPLFLTYEGIRDERDIV